MADCEDVPPLEDMSDIFSHLDLMRQNKDVSPQHTNPESVVVESENRNHSQRESRVKTLPLSDHKQSTKKLKEKQNESFGGFKKGFLFGSNKKTQEKTEDIPFIKPKQSNEKSYQIPEVQQAMEASQSLLENKDQWVTADLLSKVQKSSTLSRRLTDPKFMQALQEFQTNPQAAMMRYANNLEIQEFLKEFTSVLGEHFTKLGVDEEAKQTKISTSAAQADISVKSSTNPQQPTADDEKRLQDIMDNPEIRGILMDPQVMKLIETLRNDPDRGQHMLHGASAELQRKMHKLVTAGILQFQR